MLIIISARAPFYNAVISSHLYPKYGIRGGGQLTVFGETFSFFFGGRKGMGGRESFTAVEVCLKVTRGDRRETKMLVASHPAGTRPPPGCKEQEGFPT